MSSSVAVDVVQRLLAAWDARDLEAFSACLTDDVEWYDPAMAVPPAQGRAAVLEFAKEVLNAFPDFTYEVSGPVCRAADGSRCAIQWRIRGTHVRKLGPLGYAPTGRTAAFEGVDVLDLEDQLVKRIFTAFDLIPAAEQLLGMKLRPTPGTWRARLVLTVQGLLAWSARVRR